MLRASDIDAYMQATNITYDDDTGTLTIRLTSGEEFRITHPVHARTVRERLSVHGLITDVQREWLEQYRIETRHANRERLRDQLRILRKELWQR